MDNDDEVRHSIVIGHVQAKVYFLWQHKGKNKVSLIEPMHIYLDTTRLYAHFPVNNKITFLAKFNKQIAGLTSYA